MYLYDDFLLISAPCISMHLVMDKVGGVYVYAWHTKVTPDSSNNVTSMLHTRTIFDPSNIASDLPSALSLSKPTHPPARCCVAYLLNGESTSHMYNRYEKFLRGCVYLLQEALYKFGYKFPDTPVPNTATIYKYAKSFEKHSILYSKKTRKRYVLTAST
jgi:hypothetical protein